MDPLAALMAESEETRCLVLSLMEMLMGKTQNLGAVRQLEPFISPKDAEKIMQRKNELVEKFRQERRAQASRLVLPPGL